MNIFAGTLLLLLTKKSLKRMSAQMHYCDGKALNFLSTIPNVFSYCFRQMANNLKVIILVDRVVETSDALCNKNKTVSKSSFVQT